MQKSSTKKTKKVAKKEEKEPEGYLNEKGTYTNDTTQSLIVRKEKEQKKSKKKNKK